MSAREGVPEPDDRPDVAEPAAASADGAAAPAADAAASAADGVASGPDGVASEEPPARVPRRVPSRRRSLTLLATTFCALCGILVLAMGWVGLWVTTARATAKDVVPCLEGYGTDPNVEVRYETLPTRAVCVRWDGLEQTKVIFAAVPVGVTATALTFALGGTVGSLVVLRRMPATTVR